MSVVVKHPGVKWKIQSCDSFFAGCQTSGGLGRTSQLPKHFISYLDVYFSCSFNQIWHIFSNKKWRRVLESKEKPVFSPKLFKILFLFL